MRRHALPLAALLVLAGLPFAAAEPRSVDISGSAFRPPAVFILVNDTVTWNYVDATSHNVIFESAGAPLNCPTGSSGSAPCVRAFPTAGAYGYHCGIHPSMTGSVTVNATTPPTPPQNAAPTAAFNATVEHLRVAVDASASNDADGAIATFAWTWGDGNLSLGALASHDYAAPGNYTITLTVTDDDGASATATRVVQAIAPPPATNEPPVAAFEVNVSARAVLANGSGSSDPDGLVASYAWDWGDGNASVGALAQHEYARVGTFTIRLTVTDDDGATANATRLVTLVDALPIAAFEAIVDDTTVVVDGSASGDTEGPLATFAWDWGDGSSLGAGERTQHAYAAAGTYSIRLTVTDAAGHNASVTRPVTIRIDGSPTASFTLAAFGLGVTADASGSGDPDGPIARFAWDWGDGNGTQGAPRMTHAYAAPGNYTVRLTVTDGAGKNATNATRVALGGIRTAVAGLTLRADATGVAGAEAALLVWDFGDGEHASEAVVEHAYERTGVYNVTLNMRIGLDRETNLTQEVAVAGGTAEGGGGGEPVGNGSADDAAGPGDVPGPATWLVLSALIGLAWARRRRS